MNGINSPSGVIERFPLVFEKITQEHFKVTDDSLLEKVLSIIKDELDKNITRCGVASLFVEKLEYIIKLWGETPPEPNIAAFTLRFLGAITKSEADFQLLQETHVVDRLLAVVSNQVFSSSCSKTAYIALLSDLSQHQAGLNWITQTKSSKDIIKLCLTDSSIYVQRDGTKFILDYVLMNSEDSALNQEIQRDILFPLVTCVARNGYISNMDQDQLLKRIFPCLKLLGSLLEACAVHPNQGSAAFQALDIFQVEPILKGMISSCESDALLDVVVSAYVTLCVGQLTLGQEHPTGYDQVPDCLMDVVKLLLKRQKVWSVLEMCRHCQGLWAKVNLAQGPNYHLFTPAVEMHFIIIQMIPVMMFIKKTSRVNYFLELYLKKLSDMATDETIRLIYAFRDVIQGLVGCCPTQLALKGVLSLTKNVKGLGKDMAVLIFQGLMYVLKEFTPNACDEDEPMGDEEVEQVDLRVVPGAALLSAILNALCDLISSFSITWTESFESACVLKFTSILLKNVHMSPVLAVQTLRLARLTIINYLPPNLALLVNKIEGSSFECLAPLLYKRLHDPHWEIRDSCLELVTVLAEQAEIKYPAFQQMLLDMKICELLVSIVDGDCESYVRGSALRALSAMVKSPLLWGEHLGTLDILAMMSRILRTETEGIVRREAAWLIKQMYEHQRCRPETMAATYEVMGHAAIHDLHWEVKVNALCFWEKVIERSVADQGMIDGAFPSVTFSKEHKKIVALTHSEIRHRLIKVLAELSATGCLHVLVTALSDDCDYQVVQTAARIMSSLLTLLKQYDVVQPLHENHLSEVTTCDKKRKTSDEGCCEKRQHVDTCAEADETGEEIQDREQVTSDRVIEQIVNEMDINLLVSVCRSGQNEQETQQQEMPLEVLPPQVFLDKVQCIDLCSLLKEKSRWLQDSQNDCNTLLDNVLLLPTHNDANTLDCY